MSENILAEIQAHLSDIQNKIDSICGWIESQEAKKVIEQHPLNKGTTKWRPTKNPAVLWCPEKEADINDVDKAKAKAGGMWALSNARGEVSIFKKAA